MSRGPGRIQRTIAALMAKRPAAAFSTLQLCAAVYPGAAIEKKHRVAVLRVMHRIAAENRDWRIARSAGKASFLYRPPLRESHGREQPREPAGKWASSAAVRNTDFIST